MEINLALQDTDGSESISGNIILTDIPEGATLNVGEAGEDDTWIISQDELSVTGDNDDGTPVSWNIPNLRMRVPSDVDEDFSIGIQVTTQDGDDFNVNEANIEIDLDDDGFVAGGDDDQDDEEVVYDNEITGSDKNDHIDGTDGNDLIDGGDGNDHIDGGDGDDQIIGGDGNEQLDGGDGDDIILGGDGNDQMDGGDGDDTFVIGEGNDQMDGGDGNDLFIFGADADGNNNVDGGGGQGWIDTVELTGVDGGPGAGGDWTLETDADYTLNDDNTIDFTDGDASGTITLEDGTTLDFDNIENITW